MVRIPYIKIPSVRVGSIVPTSNMGTGGATPAPPIPITYLTQWQIVGNSEVHTDPYLTSWKVSGNSVVDNNTILSCGDLGQDGKYHVKISNGATVYDIPLTEPLRKVNDVADTIEFPSETEGKALVTRNLNSADLDKLAWSANTTLVEGKYRMISNSLKINPPTSNAKSANILSSMYETIPHSGGKGVYNAKTGIAVNINGVLSVYDERYNQSDSLSAFTEHINGVELIYELATPTTELVDAPQIAVSPTDTYTSANVTPYSAFEHTENKEIWSCGEYSATDGKYHILVQPLGGSIADIALDEPLRKVDNVADTIEFPSSVEGKALVTRNIFYDSLNKGAWGLSGYSHLFTNNTWASLFEEPEDGSVAFNILAEGFTTYTYNQLNSKTYEFGCAVTLSTHVLCLYDESLLPESGTTIPQAFYDYIADKHFIAELATPTTELVDAPQIEEADSYTCEISQGGKAVSWSSFETDSE